MCRTRASQAYKRQRHPLFQKQLVAGKWKYSRSSRFSFDISIKIWEAVWKAESLNVLAIYISFRNNLFATTCRMVQSSHISEIWIDLFEVLIAGGYYIHYLVDFHWTFQWKQVKDFWKDEIPSFLMIYNKYRYNLFGSLYHLKKLERCVAQA